MGFLHMGHTSSVVAHSTHVPWPHRNAILRGFSRQMAHMLASSISRTWAWSDSKEWSVSKYFSSFSLNSAGLAGAFFPTDEKKGENFKNRRKNYLSWVFTRPALHSLTLLYSQWNAYVHDCLFFHRLPNSLEISHFSLRMLLNISRSLWHSSAKNVDKWKPLDYQTVWKRFRHYISKILDSIPQGNKVKCFFFIYYDQLQQNVRSHLLTTGYFPFNNPLAFKALLHACGTS